MHSDGRSQAVANRPIGAAGQLGQVLSFSVCLQRSRVRTGLGQREHGGGLFSLPKCTCTVCPVMLIQPSGV